jgi:hypothetical protein
MKVERIKLRIIHGKVILNAAIRVAPARIKNVQGNIYNSSNVFPSIVRNVCAESGIISHSKSKLQVLKLRYLPRVRK